MARTADDTLSDLAMRFIVRQPNRTLTPETIARADKIIQDKDRRQFSKQEVLDALIREARLLDDTLPLCFFERDLRKLSFVGASKITEALVEAACKAAPDLEYLDLSGCFLLGDSGVAVVLQACGGLRSLKIENCRKLTNTTATHMVQFGRHLQAVSVGGNFNLDDDAIRTLLTHHPNRHNFRELSVSGVVLSAGTVASIGEACPKLRTLAIGYQDHLSEQMLLELVRRLKALRRLHVHWCHNAVTDHVLQVLGSVECVELEDLNICGVRNVTPQAIEDLLYARNGQPSHMAAAESAMEVEDASQQGRSLSGSSAGPRKPEAKKRLKRLKIRYCGASKAALETIEETWGQDVDFPS